MIRWHVEGWDPTYGSSVDQGEGPTRDTSATTDPTVELPVDDWRPMTAPSGVTAPEVVLLVDGVRRTDALLWTEEDDGGTFPGLAASYAAGVVRCDRVRGSAELAGREVRRGLFTASPSAGDLRVGQIHYPIHQVTGGADPGKLPTAVQPPLTALEIEVSGQARVDGDLLVVDGPLHGRRHLPRTLGYIKKQQGKYLRPRETSVVTALRPHQRSPIFKPGTSWSGLSWYLRLPGSGGAPWAGIVRVECSPELGIEEAIRLANLSLVTLPGFASTSYKDPRAPQNLIPIAGLERRLRALLGDSRLLHRALALAATTGRRPVE